MSIINDWFSGLLMESSGPFVPEETVQDPEDDDDGDVKEGQ